MNRENEYDIRLAAPHMSGREMEFVREAFDRNDVTSGGPQVDAFEEEFAATVGLAHAVAVSSGTAAVHLALGALGVGARDEVMASTLTFIGGVSPIIQQNASPVFIDSDRVTWTMDPDLLAEELEACRKRGQMPKAVIPTDLYGQCADLDRIIEICTPYEIPVVSNSADALGALYKDRSAGVGAGAAVYSFNGEKIITASRGGMLASDDSGLIDRARRMAQHGRPAEPDDDYSQLGCNYRLSNILAAIGRGQLKVLSERVRRKREIYRLYRDALSDTPGIELMPDAPYGKASHWLTVILVDPGGFGADRETVRLALKAERMEARPVYRPMHLQPVFTQYWVCGGSVSEDIFNRGLCLPSDTNASDGDLEKVVDVIKACGRA